MNRHQVEASWKRIRDKVVLHRERLRPDDRKGVDLIGLAALRESQSIDRQATGFCPNDYVRRSEFSVHIGCQPNASRREPTANGYDLIAVVGLIVRQHSPLVFGFVVPVRSVGGGFLTSWPSFGHLGRELYPIPGLIGPADKRVQFPVARRFSAWALAR